MILEKEIKVKITNGNRKYYQEKGYEAKYLSEEFIKLEDLSDNCGAIEKRVCDCCKKTIERKHKAWVDTFKAFGEDLCPECSKPKMFEHIKQSNLEKYGVEFPMQSEQIKEKAKQTCRNHYGCDFSFQNKDVQHKIDDIITQKYGSRRAFAQSDEICEKRKNTVNERYRCDNVFQSEEIKDKIKQTLLEEYQCDNISKNADIKNKKEETCLENYGVCHPLQSTEIMQKQRNTCLNKFGTEFPMQNKEVKCKAMETMCKNGTVPTSKPQMLLYEVIKNYYKDCIVEINYPLDTLSLDIMLVYNGYKIDIEYDGEYWHKDRAKDTKRDFFVESQGYKVLRVLSNYDIPTIQQIEEALFYLTTTNHDFYRINLIENN